MRTKVFMFVVFVVISIFSLDGLLKAEDANLASAEKIIQTLYSAHEPWKKKEIAWDNKQILSRYFDKELTALLIKDAECRKTRDGNGICNMDFDPIYDDLGIYDPNFKKPKVTIKPLSSNPRMAFEVFITDGESKKLVYYMHKQDNEWKIEDIVYDKDRSIKNILSQDG